MLSILIPTYNQKVTTLVTALARQAEATGVPYEIIVRDDASTIDTNPKTVINTIQFRKNQENQGRTATRLLLAEEARFNHLLFLDSDVRLVKDDFVATYLNLTEKPVVYGGIIYTRETYTPECSLRWHFGNERESLTAEKRNKTPYKVLISSNIFVQKSFFLELSARFRESRYGQDLIMGAYFKSLQVPVTHINNQVEHMGLESNETFLRKARDAAGTVYASYENKEFRTYASSLINEFDTWRRFGISRPLALLYKKGHKTAERILSKESPSMFLFDMYRLAYVSHLHHNQ